MNKLFKKMIAFILIFAIMTTSINLSVFADIVSGPIMYTILLMTQLRKL